MDIVERRGKVCDEFEGSGDVVVVMDSIVSHTFLLMDRFRLRKITTDPHILFHVNTVCPNSRNPKLKICISEPILDT
jgi:hypothetical protein